MQLPMTERVGDPASGQRILETRCFACHALGANRVTKLSDRQDVVAYLATMALSCCTP